MHRFSCAALVLGIALLNFSAPAAAVMPAGQPVHGIRCDPAEGTAFHIHQHLAIYDRGKPVGIPSDVGRPLLTPCFYWLHTHTPDGIIHVESPTFRSFTLGDFFDVWGEPLSKTRVSSASVVPGKSSMRIWVDGMPWHDSPRTIPLVQHADITIEVGPPWRPPDHFTQWNGL
jgi:hypothetical protein